MEEGVKRFQMFSRAYIPRNTQPERKDGIFTNVPALAFSIYVLFTHVFQNFVHIRTYFKKTIILNHPLVPCKISQQLLRNIENVLRRLPELEAG